MELRNGYKVIYEKAKNGQRTFYASKTNTCNPASDDEIASFVDNNFAGKVIYEHAGKFYVSAETLPAYNEEGMPTDACISDAFDQVFVESSKIEEEPKVLKVEEPEVLKVEEPEVPEAEELADSTEENA